jgi:ribulose-bisphosphate carboxylase large chain
LGETTGVRLEQVRISPEYVRFERPRYGVAGTRELTNVPQGPLVGTIIKPNVGLSAEATGALVGPLCEAGVDFVKDDECCANPDHAPIAERVPAVTCAELAAEDRQEVMVAFNISDEHDAMLRHADLVAREGQLRDGQSQLVRAVVGAGTAQTPRDDSGLAIHGHRNGYGMFPGILRWAWTSSRINCCGVLPASTTCTCMDCRENSRRRMPR